MDHLKNSKKWDLGLNKNEVAIRRGGVEYNIRILIRWQLMVLLGNWKCKCQQHIAIVIAKLEEKRAHRHRTRTGVSEATVLCLALNEFAIIWGTIVFWLTSELHHVTW